MENVFSLLLRACGAAVLASLCLCILGGIGQGWGVLLRMGGAVAVFGIFLYLLKSGISRLEDIGFGVGENDFASEAFVLMLKALGLAVLSKFCADICRDCGEQTLADGVEGVGRVAVFSLSVPIILKILGAAAQILGMAE